MMLVHRKAVLLGICFILALGVAGVAQAQSSKIFIGKVTEVAKATELDIGKTGTFYVLRLEEYPRIEFQLRGAEAVRAGLIKAGGSTEVLTHRQVQGLGWKVRLTCSNEPTGPLKAPVYQVKFLERID